MSFCPTFVKVSADGGAHIGSPSEAKFFGLKFWLNSHLKINFEVRPTFQCFCCNKNAMVQRIFVLQTLGQKCWNVARQFQQSSSPIRTRAPISWVDRRDTFK